MEFKNIGAELFIPDGRPKAEALTRTTHLGIAAHQDDLEIMAYHGIIECFGRGEGGFLGLTVTNGSGSPRDGLYAEYSDEEMQRVRRSEQKKAAVVGEYCALAFLDYTSAAVKEPSNPDVIADLRSLLEATRPAVVYTHNLADKHDTHVAVALRVLQALRGLPADIRPSHLYGCEVWRDLDWLADQDKIALRVDAHENLAAALLGVFDSQICGGKRYDLATAGRRRAHATYHASHGIDTSSGLTFAMDLTPLMNDPDRSVSGYVAGYIERFVHEITERLARLGG